MSVNINFNFKLTLILGCLSICYIFALMTAEIKLHELHKFV